ncbi:patatin [Halieaceae bacterium IMCC14734]|uniref:Patatin n=2 Tax=Candidatus Litorirhabdus singularis TaxID=2518993 RepID=A0ABT3TPV2_9GAMM|nr:patatin [Candidatus Litorirhabdus singularis]
MKNKLIRNSLWIILLALAGCSGIVRNPLPVEAYADATILGRSDLRYWADTSMFEVSNYSIHDTPVVDFTARYAGISDQEHSYLAISGGGSKGAYGAGVLVGWTEMGTRPQFAIVTGVSTGALIAPFAFLGPEYDQQLKEAYTTLGTDSVIKIGNIFRSLANDGLMDSSPLTETLNRYVNEEMIKKIAAEHRKGRRLLIGTTNLDAGRQVIWNIGRIADSGHPDSADLIRDIMRASASIPGTFPPVYFTVEANGESYDEMHVDGGVAAQMFLYPSSVSMNEVAETLKVKGKPHAYLIGNSLVHPQYLPTSPSIYKITRRTISTLTRTQGVGDVYQIYAVANRDGVDVSLTWIPEDAVEEVSNEPFDPVYMSALFEYGYQRALKGEVWRHMQLN